MTVQCTDLYLTLKPNVHIPYWLNKLQTLKHKNVTVMTNIIRHGIERMTYKNWNTLVKVQGIKTERRNWSITIHFSLFNLYSLNIVNIIMNSKKMEVFWIVLLISIFADHMLIFQELICIFLFLLSLLQPIFKTFMVNLIYRS